MNHPSDPSREAFSRQRRFAAGCVHAFTASGAVCALMATLAVAEGAYERCFAWLGLALVIDGIDGTFARMVDVKRVLPRFSGERLDTIVDYATYVFVPVLALLKAQILAGGLGVVIAALILMSSLYHFTDEGSKSDDNCFVGFPAIWNIVAFYLFALALPRPTAVGLVLLCIALTFVPMRWLHPVRVRRLMAVNLLASVLWLLAAAHVIATGFPAATGPSIVLAAVAAYALWLTLTWPMSRYRDPD